VDADLAIEPEDSNVADHRIDAALNSDLLARCDRRQHARALERGDEGASLAPPQGRNSVEFGWR
jgi:hypothetical protein